MFRVNSARQIVQMLYSLVFNLKSCSGIGLITMVTNSIFFLWVLLLIEIIQLIKKDSLAILKLNVFVRGIIYLVCFYLMMIFGANNAKEFIYFQF